MEDCDVVKRDAVASELEDARRNGVSLGGRVADAEVVVGGERLGAQSGPNHADIQFTAKGVEGAVRQRVRIVARGHEEHAHVGRLGESREEKSLDACEVVDAGDDQWRVAERLRERPSRSRWSDRVFIVRGAVGDGCDVVGPGGEDVS